MRIQQVLNSILLFEYKYTRFGLGDEIDLLEQQYTNELGVDHLGDAYLKVNRELEALYQWKKAIQFNSEEDLRIKIEDKIKKFNANDELNFL